MKYISDFKPVKINGKGKKRIDLKPSELRLFQEMLVHHVMPSKAVHEFLQAAGKRMLNGTSISNRLARLRDSKLLLRMEKEEGGFKSYFYKLSKRGIYCLVECGVINEQEAEKYYNHIISLRIPSAHTLGICQLVNRVIVRELNYSLPKFRHYRGLMPGYQNQVAEKSLGLIPDWTFQREQRYVHLEMDTGSQSHRVIESKINRYIKYALQNQEKEIMLVFSVFDESLGIKSLSAKSDRSKRIRALKDLVPSLKHWPENLSIYVLAAERTAAVILDLLTYRLPYDDADSMVLLHVWKEKAKKNILGANFLLHEGNENFYGTYKGPKAEELVSILSPHNRWTALVLGVEGSVATYQQIRALHRLTKESVLDSNKLKELIVIYPTEEAMIADVYGQPLSNAWFSYKDYTSFAMYKLVSPFKKKLFIYE